MHLETTPSNIKAMSISLFCAIGMFKITAILVMITTVKPTTPTFQEKKIKKCPFFHPIDNAQLSEQQITEGAHRFGVRLADNDRCTADKRPTGLTPGISKIQ